MGVGEGEDFKQSSNVASRSAAYPCQRLSTNCVHQSQRFLSVVLIAGLRKSTMKFFVVVFFFHRPMTSLKYRTGATEYHRQERPGMINAPLSTKTCTHNTDKSNRRAGKPFLPDVLVFVQSCSMVMARHVRQQPSYVLEYVCTFIHSAWSLGQGYLSIQLCFSDKYPSISFLAKYLL